MHFLLKALCAVNIFNLPRDIFFFNIGKFTLIQIILKVQGAIHNENQTLIMLLRRFVNIRHKSTEKMCYNLHNIQNIEVRFFWSRKGMKGSGN